MKLHKQPVNPWLALPDDAEPPVEPEMLALGASGLGGSALADSRGRKGIDRLRGLFKGLATGGGAVAGARLAATPESPIGPATLPYAAGGGLLGFLAASGLSRLAGMEKARPPDIALPDRRRKHASPGAVDTTDIVSNPAVEAGVDAPPMTPSPISRLLQAKAHSDRKEYGRKHIILRQLLTERPQEFEITEQTPDGFAYGLRHTKSGFLIHMPRRLVPPGVELPWAGRPA